MEKLKAELAAKSLYLPTLNASMLFSWSIFATSQQKYGITIDAHAMIDPARSGLEGLKLVTLCVLNYADTAKCLGVEVAEVPNAEAVEAWMVLCPDEAKAAMEYCTRMFSDSIAEKKKVGN